MTISNQRKWGKNSLGIAKSKLFIIRNHKKIVNKSYSNESLEPKLVCDGII